MRKKILLILAHPAHASFCGALARAYLDGANKSGAEVRELVLADLRFDPVRAVNPADPPPLEPDLHVQSGRPGRSDRHVDPHQQKDRDGDH